MERVGHTFREVRTLRALPPSVQAALGVGSPGPDGIAERDRRYNPTDVILDSNLPMRRFLVAGLADNATLVAIEHGGRGWNGEVRLFSNVGGRCVVQRQWTLSESPRTLRGLVDRLSPDREIPVGP